MAYSSLLSTKFYVPPVRSTLISRPRLLERLTHGLGGPLTLISAPAGYGKTTLVSSWLKEKKIPFAWISLDSGDNDPIRFLQYLIAAMAPFAPDVEAEAPGMLQESTRPIRNRHQPAGQRAGLHSDPFVLVWMIYI
jgi:LuxR family maltose regulon positive regulatory protein